MQPTELTGQNRRGHQTLATSLADGIEQAMNKGGRESPEMVNIGDTKSQ